MFPSSHELHYLAHQKQQDLLAEAEHMRLIRRATSHAKRARSGDGPRLRLAAIRTFLAAALYALAKWIDAGEASLHPAASRSPRLTT